MIIGTNQALQQQQPLQQQSPNQFAVAGQQPINAIGSLLGALAGAIAPGTWMGNVGQVGQAANQQLLQQQASQKQTSQINQAGQQQAGQLQNLLAQLLNGGEAPAANQPIVAPQAAPGGAQQQAPFLQALPGLSQLLNQWFNGEQPVLEPKPLT